MVLHKEEYITKILALTKQDWKPLLDLIPEIEGVAGFGEASIRASDTSGVFHMPFYEESSIVSRFRELVYKLPVIVDFDWMSWDEGRKILNDESFNYNSIDIPAKCKIITAIVRSDRFCEGALVNAFESGLILNILKSIEAQLSFSPMEITGKLKDFIEKQTWTFAKTYATTWPHEYIVQEKVDNEMFSELANIIDTFGYDEFFYDNRQKYLDYNGYTYWHMENIINRCVVEDTYHRRKMDGRLPKI